jgi:hypothetical protein
MGITDAPAPPPGWYPDPTGTAARSYWNGTSWASPPPKDNRNKLVAGGIIGAGVLGLLIGNAGNDSDSRPLPSPVTSTVTVASQPTTVMSTVTVAPPPVAEPPIDTAVQAAPPDPWALPASEAPPPAAPPPSETYPLVPQLPAPSSAYYSNCSEARSAGAAPLYVGSPGYRSRLDRDGDGVACES